MVSLLSFFPGVYTTFVMFMNTTSVMLTVLVLNLHHRNERKPVPGWVRTVAFDFLARVLCMRSKNENYYQQNGYNRPEVEPKAQSQLRERKKKQKSDSYNLAYAARQFSTNLPSSAVMFTPNNSTSSPTENATYTESKSSYRSRVHEDHKAQYASVPREPTGGGAGSDADTPPYDHYMHPHPEHQQWKALARIVDRLFFWLTLFALISASLGTFCLLWSWHGITYSYAGIYVSFCLLAACATSISGVRASSFRGFTLRTLYASYEHGDVVHIVHVGCITSMLNVETKRLQEF